MNRSFLTLNLSAAFALALVLVPPGLTHESPEHVIEALTARIKAVGPRPDLLWRRATEYRALGQLGDAERDLRRATRAKKDFVAAWIDLSRVQLARGSTRSARRTIERAVALEERGSFDPGVCMVQAEILAASSRVEEAVAACDRALASPDAADPEWFLTRCQLQYRLGRYQDAAAGMRRGFELTGNPVLEVEWIDAAIDAGQAEKVLSRINTRLAEARLRAAWLIRRGRALGAIGEVTASQADYLGAIRELDGRLAGSRSDLVLLAERGLAYALLGDPKPARADLARAKSLGADAWSLARLERAIGQ